MERLHESDGELFKELSLVLVPHFNGLQIKQLQCACLYGIQIISLNDRLTLIRHYLYKDKWRYLTTLFHQLESLQLAILLKEKVFWIYMFVVVVLYAIISFNQSIPARRHVYPSKTGIKSKWANPIIESPVPDLFSEPRKHSRSTIDWTWLLALGSLFHFAKTKTTVGTAT